MSIKAFAKVVLNNKILRYREIKELIAPHLFVILKEQGVLEG